MPVLQTFGVDVGKRELAIAHHESSAQHTITNSARAISEWLEQFAEPVQIGVESTGVYHQPVNDKHSVIR